MRNKQTLRSDECHGCGNIVYVPGRYGNFTRKPTESETHGTNSSMQNGSRGREARKDKDTAATEEQGDGDKLVAVTRRDERDMWMGMWKQKCLSIQEMQSALLGNNDSGRSRGMGNGRRTEKRC